MEIDGKLLLVMFQMSRSNPTHCNTSRVVARQDLGVGPVLIVRNFNELIIMLLNQVEKVFTTKWKKVFLELAIFQNLIYLVYIFNCYNRKIGYIQPFFLVIIHMNLYSYHMDCRSGIGTITSIFGTEINNGTKFMSMIYISSLEHLRNILINKMHF